MDRKLILQFKQHHGFTLIEVMIVVAIIGIISAIALPTYREQVRRGQRAELRTQMFAAAQYMNRFYAANDSFSATRNGTAVSIPATLTVSPPSGDSLYQLDTTNSVLDQATTFTLVYEPINGMAGDACGSYTLTNTGLRGNSGNTKAVAECWK